MEEEEEFEWVPDSDPDTEVTVNWPDTEEAENLLRIARLEQEMQEMNAYLARADELIEMGSKKLSPGDYSRYSDIFSFTPSEPSSEVEMAKVRRVKRTGVCRKTKIRVRRPPKTCTMQVTSAPKGYRATKASKRMLKKQPCAESAKLMSTTNRARRRKGLMPIRVPKRVISQCSAGYYPRSSNYKVSGKGKVKIPRAYLYHRPRRG